LISHLAAFLASPLLRLRTATVNTYNGVLIGTGVRSQNHFDATRRLRRSSPRWNPLTLFCADKPNRVFTVITFCIDKVSGVALDLETGVPCYQAEDEEGRIHLLIQLPIGEKNENRWCLWRPDQAELDSKSIFDGALIEE